MNNEMAYGARFPSMPGFGAVMVDDPSRKADTAKFVSDCINDGATIERVTIDHARRGVSEYLAAKSEKGD